MRVNGLQSRSIDVMRFAMILLVVVLHAYTSTRSDFSAGDFPVYRLVSFVCSLEIAQTAVPALFFISGFLFFLHPKPYKTKLRKTSKRLIVPYLLWNALILALYFGVEQIPALSKYFSGVNPPVSEYSFVNFLQAFWDSGEWRGGNGTPILHQFWYIRNLILLALLSPAIRLFVRGFGWWGAAALWGPGAFEVPLIAKKMAESQKYDAVVCLGAVIRGATPHFDMVANEATKGIANVGLQVGIPVIFGILTTDSIEQAVERAGTKAGNKGFDAMTTAIEMVNLIRTIG